ncbi:MAG: [FeFe] hydrogenase H-cluster maturation GTPase HydF [Planctomycetota bacterium]|jgi:[FeFe] hydrogenase H-cluster maturation GTPase HydF
MLNTSKGMRLHIGIFGRRNAGKSSLLNALVRQDVSIVSDVKGTTTDPVEKPMELQPIGPVLFIDTAGIDDEGVLGGQRVDKTRKVIERTDIAILLLDGEWGKFEDLIYQEFKTLKIPVLAVCSKTDINPVSDATAAKLKEKNIPFAETALPEGKGISQVRNLIITNAPEEFINSPGVVSDLLPAGELAMLVVPIDLEAPKGRLILPQVQTIRDVLDNDAYCMIVKERELRNAFDRLNHPPALVITDSQAFLKVGADTPNDIPMTSFSILFARMKGDLNEFVRGLKAIDKLKSGDKVLVLESCSHHPTGEDIGRVKIPRWLRQYTGASLEFDTVQGHDFPENLTDYSLVIQCGACMWNRREVLTRIMKCKAAGVPITNYGLTISYSLGICERALRPFPGALEILKNN